ncbi:MAG: hypothetical protein C0505_15000 [Leptothrix sp. (in: Bacteria)]|nr:hypothetical protein [Leptothrix sp. (in: b-proteobacteria)]
MDETETMLQRQRALWPAADGADPTVWALLDLARDRAVHAALIDSRLEHLCLYSGRLPRELELAAPHMVQLLPGHRLTQRLLGETFGRSWGVFLTIADPANLRHHLRKFLKVSSDHGRPLLFRYYDPRVLRAFLPTADGAQLAEFFGPVERWLAEDGAGGLLEYRRDGVGRLLQRQATSAPQPATLGS